MNINTFFTAQFKPRPFWLMLYGSMGIGKSSFVAKLYKPLAILFEDGAHALPTLRATSVIKSYAELLKLLEQLLKAPQLDAGTLIFDGLERLDDLLDTFTLKELGINAPSEAPFGGFYSHKTMLVYRLIRIIREISAKHNLAIAFIGHDKIKTVQSPAHAAYDQIGLRASDRLAAPICDECDIVGYATFNLQVRETKGQFGNIQASAVTDGKRMLKINPSAAYLSKTRYTMPDCPLDAKVFMVNYKKAIDALKATAAPAVPAAPAAVPAVEAPAVPAAPVIE